MSSLPAQIAHPVLAVNEKFIPLHRDNTVSPYMTMIYALDLLEEKRYHKRIKAFIQWYIDHMNKIDRFGVSGTVYDYNITLSGKEHSLQTYDSADGYAGIFLYLVRRYYESSNDHAFITAIFPSLKDTVYLLYHLRDSDGLIKALPQKNYKVKYLMDNVEAYRGVEAYILLAKLTQGADGEEIAAYTLFQNEIKDAILNELYEKDSGLFCWAKDGEKRYCSSTNIFYPDMFAQMHLLALWGKNIDPNIRRGIWRNIKIFIDKKAINMDIFRQYEEKNTGEYDPKIAMEQLIIFEWAKAFALQNDL